jgi:hypothetical protein
MASLEGWSTIMYSTVDAVAIDQQPINNYNKSMELFSIVFVIIGSFLMLNLIAGVAIDKFKQVRVLKWWGGEGAW